MSLSEQRAASTVACLHLVAERYARIPAELGRALSREQLAVEVARLLYAHARREAQRLWDAHDDLPRDASMVSRVIRARYAQIKAAAKTEEDRRLREEMLARAARQALPSS